MARVGRVFGSDRRWIKHWEYKRIGHNCSGRQRNLSVALCETCPSRNGYREDRHPITQICFSDGPISHPFAIVHRETIGTHWGDAMMMNTATLPVPAQTLQQAVRAFSMLNSMCFTGVHSSTPPVSCYPRSWSQARASFMPRDSRLALPGKALRRRDGTVISPRVISCLNH